MKNKYIKFNSPLILNQEIKEIQKTLKSGWLTTGSLTSKFENNFKRYKKANYSLAVNSCTAALHLSLTCLNLKKKDEVITTALTFSSTINSIVHAGATPVLADIDLYTHNISPDEIKKKITKNTKAILIVHFAGRPCDMNEIMKIAKKNKLYVIEDCAHAVESRYNNKETGTFGDFGCFSFYSTKNIVTGEGGMIITKKKKYYNRLKSLSLHGMDKGAYKRYGKSGYRHYDVNEFGFKYNMMDLQSSLGIHQLKRVEKNLSKRLKIWHMYCNGLKNLNIGLPIKLSKNIKHGLHLFIIQIEKKKLGLSRDQFINEMHKKKIGIGIHYRSIPEHSIYRKTFGWKKQDYPVAKKVGEQTISLPLSAKLTKTDVNRIIKSIKRILKQK